ncbi:hypothetical protein [Mycetocola sp. 2940]|uniref:hypothetical protein n=1 Tax=Mycetocola sp. 2940 TaxID=3156452 RepID=UPI003397FB74
MTDEPTPVAPRPEPRPVPEPAEEKAADTTATTPLSPAQAQGPYPLSAFTYPAAPAELPRRSWGKRTVLLLIGAAVIVSALLFGGGFWAGSAVSSVPGISYDRSGDDPRVGPGGPGDRRLPGREEDESDTDTDSDSTDPTIFEG